MRKDTFYKKVIAITVILIFLCVSICTGNELSNKSFSEETRMISCSMERLYPTNDTDISHMTPDINYGSDVTNDVRNEYGWVPGWASDILIRFDLSSLPSGTLILSAVLKQYYWNFQGNTPAGRSLNLYRITSDWDESMVTWNTQPSNAMLPTTNATVPSSPGSWMEWNVTTDVQNFVNGSKLNFGWKVTDENSWGWTDIPITSFRSKEYSQYIPYLEIQIDEKNKPPITPSTPDGPSSRKIGVSGLYSTSSADPDNNDVLYLWDWDGDDVFDEWTSYYASGQTVSTSHSWATAGRYEVKVKAEDEHGAQSFFSSALVVMVYEETIPPNKPILDGPILGKAGKSYTFSAMTTDPDGDKVEYLFDWDDQTISGWKGLYNSSETCHISHIWDAQGTYSIKVKARDIHGAESIWSDPLPISMSKSKATRTVFLQALDRLVEKFPLLKQRIVINDAILFVP